MLSIRTHALSAHFTAPSPSSVKALTIDDLRIDHQYQIPQYGEEIVKGKRYGDMVENPSHVDMVNGGGVRLFANMPTNTELFHNPNHPVYSVLRTIAKDTQLQQESPIMKSVSYLQVLFRMFMQDARSYARVLLVFMAMMLGWGYQTVTANTQIQSLQGAAYQSAQTLQVERERAQSEYAAMMQRNELLASDNRQMLSQINTLRQQVSEMVKSQTELKSLFAQRSTALAYTDDAGHLVYLKPVRVRLKTPLSPSQLAPPMLSQ
jgi:hypothetical protein